jgi:histidine kinase
MMDGLFPLNDKTLATLSLEVSRMSRLVDDLQTLSRVEAGQFSLILTNCDICEIALQIAAQLRPQCHAKKIDLAFSCSDPQVIVCGDRDRVTQIFLNLLGNAVTYTFEEGQIWLRVYQDSRMATVEVQDTGVGFTEDQLPFIFERFYRVDPSRSRSSGGSGIGLTISRHLAWAMGGELSAASEGPGKGSIFVLTLPRAGVLPSEKKANL